MTIIVYLIQNLVKSQQAKNCNKCKSVKSLKSVKSVTILKICGIRRIRIASIGLTRRSRRDDPPIELLGTDSCRGTVPMEPPMSNSSMRHQNPDLDFDDTGHFLQGASCTIAA